MRIFANENDSVIHDASLKFQSVIKSIRHIFNWVLWILVGIVIMLFILLRIPAVQRYMGDKAAETVSEKIGAKVNLGRIDVGFPNRIIIDDLQIFDQQEEPMLSSSRMSAKVDIPSLLTGKISILSSQLFGLKAHLYKKSASEPFNFQFVIDSLQSKEKQKESRLDLNIKSLIVRNGTIIYDQLDMPRTPSVISPHHLHLSNISSHLILDQLTDQSLKLRVKKLTLKEESGLDLKSLSFNLMANHSKAKVTDLNIVLPSSNLKADTLETTYQMADGKLIQSSLKYRGIISQSHIKPSDLAFIMPQLKEIQEPFDISTSFVGSTEKFSLLALNINSSIGLHLSADGTYDNHQNERKWYANIGKLGIKSNALQHLGQLISINNPVPSQLFQLGDIEYTGHVGGTKNEYALKGDLSTDIGDLALTLGIQGNHFNGHAETDGIQLGTILNNSDLGVVATVLDVDGNLPFSRSMSLFAKGEINKLELKGHTYNNIQIDGIYNNGTFNGLIGIDDPNGSIVAEGMMELNPQAVSANLTAHARHFNPSALALLDNYKDHVFDFDLKTDLKGSSLSDLQGIVDLENLSINAPGTNYQLNSLHIDTDNTGDDKHIELHSDFGQMYIKGNYDLEHLSSCISNIIKKKLPSLTFLPRQTQGKNSQFEFSADIDRSDWLSLLTSVPININSPLHLNGDVDETAETINLTCQAPNIEYKESNFRDVNLHLTTLNDTLHASLKALKMSESGVPFEISLISNALNDNLSANLWFNNHGGKRGLKGNISATAHLFEDKQDRQGAQVSMRQSNIYIGGAPWTVEPSVIRYSKDHVDIDHFMVKNGDQHIIVSGALTDNITDTIHVDINQLDAGFLSNILNVRGIHFGGDISGEAFVTSVYETPLAEANLFIDNFQFVDGRIGDMALVASWNAKDNKILLDGKAKDGAAGTTDVDGFVSLSPGGIDLNIYADGTPLHFLESFIGSVIDDLDTRAKGYVRLFGPFSGINLEGKVVNNGTIHVKPLNTTYTLINDTLTLVPDHIIFNSNVLYDKDGHQGVLSGSVDHQDLGSFTFDFDIDANRMLCYDVKEFGNDTFCGTVYATGDCQLKGRSGEVTIDVVATPESNTVFYYNAASPDMLNNQDFIKWNDATPEILDFSSLPSANQQLDRDRGTFYETEEDPDDLSEEDDLPSDLRMTLRINANPNAALRLLMDQESGDYIELHGNGTLRASYFNNGSFTLFGNYVVDNGIYKLTIQNIIKKDFQFQQGGTIQFGGNPLDAALDLKANYTVNGVPLSDLNLSRNFSTNNIRVNCIMNITGTPQQPSIDFDMEMPTVNSDAQQMIRSLMNSEEELNQQVIYLLAIGRFYNQASQLGDEEQNQTSLMMQSFLSGTISQQISSVLSNVVNNNKWNFGANISTGDEGFNNAEYEGILSGRLMNDRLLINGQFGYRDNPNATTSIIGDFDIRYLLDANGNLAVKVYNQTNDRYFVKNSLNTQGLGLIVKKDFNHWGELFGLNRKKKTKFLQYEKTTPNTHGNSNTSTHNNGSKEKVSSH